MDIRATIEDVSSVEKRISVEIPADEGLRTFEATSREFQRSALIPGFRRGKAPLGLVKRRFKDDIRSEIVQKLVPDSLNQALREHKVSPISQPALEKLDFEEGKPLIFEAVFEVKPEISLPKYRSLELKVEKRQVGDADVDERLEKLRQDFAQLVSVEDRKAISSDSLIVDLRGEFLNLEEGKAQEDFVEEGVLVELDGENTHPAFAEHLLGAAVGEDRTFEIQYEPDYPSERLAGKQVKFTVHVNDVKKRVLPELNDEFAGDLGNFESLDEVRGKIRKDLEESALGEYAKDVRHGLLDQIISAADFDLPSMLVKERTDELLEDFARRVASRGVDPMRASINWQKLREEFQPRAERDVRVHLLLDEISEAEGIDPSSEEIEQEIGRIAESMNQPREKVRQYFHRKEELAGLRLDLRRRKALDIIEATAKIH